jgi:hypothetical protein
MTMSPRASEVIKLGSPVYMSREEAGVVLVEGAIAGGVAGEMGWLTVRLMRIPFP